LYQQIQEAHLSLTGNKSWIYQWHSIFFKDK
jgi:hypothetical protein